MSDAVGLILIAVGSGVIGAALAQALLAHQRRASETAKILRGLRKPTWRVKC